MEQTPKDSDDSIRSFETLADDVSEKRYLFDAQLLRGKDSLDAIRAEVSATRAQEELAKAQKEYDSLRDANGSMKEVRNAEKQLSECKERVSILSSLEKSEATSYYDNLHTKQKILLSHIAHDPVTLFSVQRPQPGSLAYRFGSIDAHGLEVRGKTFNFDSDFQNKLHHEFVSEIIEGAESDEDFYSRLIEANSEFRSLLRGRAELAVRSDIQKEFLAKCGELQAEYRSHNQNISPDTLRVNFIAQLKPDLDEDSLKAISSDFVKTQSKYTSRRSSLFYYYKLYKDESLPIVKEDDYQITLEQCGKELTEAQKEYDELLKNCSDQEKLKKAKKRISNLATLEKYKEKLEEAQKEYDTLKANNGSKDDIDSAENRLNKYRRRTDNLMALVNNEEEYDRLSAKSNDHNENRLSKYKGYIKKLAVREKCEDGLEKAQEELEEAQKELEEAQKELEEAQKEYDTLKANNGSKDDIRNAKRKVEQRKNKADECKKKVNKNNDIVDYQERGLKNVAEEIDNITTVSRNIVKGINAPFMFADLSILEYDTLEKLSAIKQQPANSPKIEQIMYDIKNNKIDKKDELYEIAMSYRASASRIKSHNYMQDIIDDEGVLESLLYQKTKKAFARRNQLFYNLSEKDSNTFFERDFVSEYEKLKKEYVIEHSNLSDNEYEYVKRNQNHFSFKNVTKSLRFNLPGSLYDSFDYAIRVLHDTILGDISSELAKEGSLHAPKEIQTRVFDKMHGSNRQFLENLQIIKQTEGIFFTLKNNLSTEQAKEQVLDILAPKNNEQSDDYAQQLEHIISGMRKYINARVKYYDTLARFGTSLCQDDREALQSDISQLEIQKNTILNSLPEERVLAEEKRIMRDFSHSLFGENIDETFVFPTGFIIIDNNGSYQALSVDTSSSDIASHIDRDKQDLWQAYLRSDEMSGSRCKKRVISAINSLIEEEFNNNLDYVSDDERNVAIFCQEHQIAPPPTLSQITGTITEQLTARDCDSARHCIERLGRYIKDINISPLSTSNISKDILIASVKEFFAGGPKVCAGLLSDSKDHNGIISIKYYSAIADNLGADMADAMLIDSISSSIYIRNEKNLEPIMRKIFGDNLNMSMATTFRLTGKKIISPETRKKVTMRALFTSSYNRFIRGEEIENPQLAQLIRRVDNIEYGQR